jgi:alpha-L-arabinofuranosidase
VLQTQPGCSGATLGWNLHSPKAPFTGTIEVRNLRLLLLREFGPYQAMIGCASLSANGKRLYLIVFNKHPDKDIAASVRIVGTNIASGRRWTVTGPSLEATNLHEELVKETVSGATVEGLHDGAFSQTFPKHSMSAIELVVSGTPAKALPRP